MSKAVATSISSPLGQRAWIALGVALVAGATLRFTWNADMEFKGDESWMYQRAVHVGRGEPWPELGMPSGVGLRNPGFSVWLFVGLSHLTGATTPLQLERGVVALNVAALVLLAFFIWRCVPEDEREIWMWAAALAAVNPLGLLLQRKIRAQSTLPLFCVLFLWGWWWPRPAGRGCALGLRRRAPRADSHEWLLPGCLLPPVHSLFIAAGPAGPTEASLGLLVGRVGGGGHTVAAVGAVSA